VDSPTTPRTLTEKEISVCVCVWCFRIAHRLSRPRFSPHLQDVWKTDSYIYQMAYWGCHLDHAGEWFPLYLIWFALNIMYRRSYQKVLQFLAQCFCQTRQIYLLWLVVVQPILFSFVLSIWIQIFIWKPPTMHSFSWLFYLFQNSCTAIEKLREFLRIGYFTNAWTSLSNLWKKWHKLVLWCQILSVTRALSSHHLQPILQHAGIECTGRCRLKNILC